MLHKIKDHLSKSAAAFAALSEDAVLHEAIERAARTINKAFKRKGRLYAAGNGGSAADAQHFAAELVGRYGKGDRSRPAIALTTDTSFLTAWGNDDTFDNVFARQIQAHAREGDVFLAISTSGSSPNILRGLKAARERKVRCIGLLGKAGAAAKLCDTVLAAPAEGTPHVQELHTAIMHALCACIDR